MCVFSPNPSLVCRLPSTAVWKLVRNVVVKENGAVVVVLKGGIEIALELEG